MVNIEGLTKQELDYFNELHKIRSGFASYLNMDFAEELKKQLSDIYSDKAHFVCELIQNADDVKATKAEFILQKDRLIFIHNGKRHFSVSNPHTEPQDALNHVKGDLNAITAAGKTNKPEESIGKFGIGFKAVFQYTDHPEIYDSRIRFRLRDYFVPELIEEDYPGRKQNETVFVFPFDKQDPNPELAFQEISEKLRSLCCPTLFLNNLKVINFDCMVHKGRYSSEVTDEKTDLDNAVGKLIQISTKIDTMIIENSIWMFSRENESNALQYSVGFLLDLYGKPIPVNVPAFCYFPTKVDTQLNTIVHAPFILSRDRESIPNNRYNEQLIENLSVLAADSISFLVQIGEEDKHRIIDESIFDIVPLERYPYRRTQYPPIFKEFEEIAQTINYELEEDRRFYYKFFETYQNAFKACKIIPAERGYVHSKDAYYSGKSTRELINGAQLKTLANNKSAKWVFSEETFTYKIENYLGKIIYVIEPKDLFGSEEKEFPGIDIAFVQKILEQSDSFAWLHKLYQWAKSNSVDISRKSVFVDEFGNVVPAYRDKALTLFLPSDYKGDFATIHPKLIENEKTREFLIKTVGMKEPDPTDIVFMKILPKCEEGDLEDPEGAFKTIFGAYLKNKSRDKLLKRMASSKFIWFVKQNKESLNKSCSINEIYLPTEELKYYFKVVPETLFLDLQRYYNLYEAKMRKKLDEFFIEIGVKTSISLVDEPTSYWDNRYAGDKRLCYASGNNNNEYWTHTIIDGCEENLRYIAENNDSERSFKVWKLLLKLIEKECNTYRGLGSKLVGCHHYEKIVNVFNESFESCTINQLQSIPWLLCKNGEFLSPNSERMVLDYLSDEYVKESEQAESLIKTLGISLVSSDDIESQQYESLTYVLKDKIDFADSVSDLGLSFDEALKILSKFKK